MGFRTSDTQRSYAQPRSYALLNLHRCSRSCVSAAIQGNYTYNTKSQRQKDEQTPDEPAKNDDSIEQLEKLAELKDKGIISEEEFEQKKADLLTKI